MKLPIIIKNINLFKKKNVIFKLNLNLFIDKSSLQDARTGGLYEKQIQLQRTKLNYKFNN